MRRLGISRRLMVVVAMLVFAVGGRRGDAQMEVRPTFEVASIKPSPPDAQGYDWDMENNRLKMRNVTLKILIKSAFDLKTNAQLLQAPDWIDKQHFDISARIGDEEWARLKKLTPEESQAEQRLLLQELLKERFDLAVQEESRVLPVYALVVDAAGIRMKESSGTEGKSRSISIRNGHMEASGIAMDNLVSSLSGMYEVGNRAVVNRTGLMGKYNFELNWAPDHGGGIAADATLPGLFPALKEQLGLRLEKAEAPLRVVLVEKASVPQFD